MALIKCDKCGQKMSDKAIRCPHCGALTGKTLVTETPITQKSSSSQQSPESQGRQVGMNMVDAVKSVFTKYAVFTGRASRSEYWYWRLLCVIVVVFCYIISPKDIYGGVRWTPLYWIWAVATLIPDLSVTWRRLHDVNKNGAFAFIALIPFIGWILLLIPLLKESDNGVNSYGPKPLNLSSG